MVRDNTHTRQSRVQWQTGLIQCSRQTSTSSSVCFSSSASDSSVACIAAARLRRRAMRTEAASAAAQATVGSTAASTVALADPCDLSLLLPCAAAPAEGAQGHWMMWLIASGEPPSMLGTHRVSPAATLRHVWSYVPAFSTRTPYDCCAVKHEVDLPLSSFVQPSPQ